MSQQLVKKGTNGKHENVMPKSWIEAIKDKNTGQTLVEILQGFNMYFLPYNGNTSSTRCLVPTMLRKKGLWITYVKYDGNVYTEWYAASEIDDKSWGDSSNWRIGNNTLVGDITISANGNWVINSTETEFKAVGEKGNTPLLRVANNRLQVSYDLGDTYIDVTNNPVYTKFRWLATTGDTQANNVGRIQASTDEGKTWTNMSNDFTNNLHISRYIGVNESLPTSGIAEGTIYAKGPYYAEDDALNDNPIYRLWVYAWKGDTLAWQDNGEFQSIAAGIVQETGDSEIKVMSQAAVTRKLSDLASEVNVNKMVLNSNINVFSFNARYTKGTGTYVEGGSYNTTDFIPLSDIRGLEFQYSFPEEASVNKYSLFSQNKDFVGFDSSLNNIVIDDIIASNPNAYYIRLSCKTSDLETFNVVQSNASLYRTFMKNKEEYESNRQVIINHHYYSDGKLQSYLGRVAINGFFSTDKEVKVVIRKEGNMLTRIVRYYDIDFNHLGTEYSESAKYFTISFLVNDLKTITKEDVLGITIQINGVLYDIITNSLVVNTKIISTLEMSKQLLINYQYYTEGLLEEKIGRVAINGHFAISEQPEVFVYDKDRIAKTTIIRYYDEEFNHLGTIYSYNAKYCTIAFVVDDVKRLSIGDIKGYSVYINGINFSIISDSLLPNSVELNKIDSKAQLLSASPLNGFLAKNTTYSPETGEKVSGQGRTYDSTYMIKISDIVSLDITYEHPSEASVNKVSLFDEYKVYIGNSLSTDVAVLREQYPNAVYVIFSIAHSLKYTLKCWYNKLPLKWDGKFPYKEEGEERVDFSSAEFEQGGLSYGQPIESETRIRLNTALKCNVGERYKFTVNNGYELNIHFMSDIETYGGEFSGWKQSVDVDNKFPYVKIVVRKNNESAIQPTENVGMYFLNWKKVADEIVGKSQLEGIDNKTSYIPLLAAKIFRRVGCIGDSYTAGYIKLTDEGLPNNTYPLWSWVHYMKNITGETWDNWGKGGSTAKSWIEGYANLTQVTAEGNKCQAYVIGLMINDQNSGNPYYTPLGTIDDIGTDADTYYAYYYKLIKKCVEVNPLAKIFCNTCPKSGSRYAQYNQAVRDVVNYCYNTEKLNVYLCDLASEKYMTEEYYGNPVFTDDYIQGHYSPICYEFMAECFVKVMSNVIMEHLKDFQNVFLIPYDEA